MPEYLFYILAPLMGSGVGVFALIAGGNKVGKVYRTWRYRNF